MKIGVVDGDGALLFAGPENSPKAIRLLGEGNFRIESVPPSDTIYRWSGSAWVVDTAKVADKVNKKSTRDARRAEAKAEFIAYRDFLQAGPDWSTVAAHNTAHQHLFKIFRGIALSLDD